MVTIGLFAALGSLGLALASEPPPPPMVNGEETSEWPAIGVLVAVDLESGAGAVYCSATLVDDLAIVSAAHCAEAGEQYDGWGYDSVFAVGPTVDEVSDYVVVDHWSIHPDYVFTDTEVMADIAVGFLAEPLQGDVEPMPFVEEAMGQAWYDEDLVVVGYGITGDRAQDPGTKRKATLPVYTLYGDFVLAVDEDAEGSNACSGDSGGAALRDDGSGHQLVGVLSFVFAHHADTSCIGGGVGATRLDLFGTWLAAEIEGGAGAGGGGSVGESSGSGSLGTEEPGGCAHLPLGAPMLLFPLLVRRRRSAVG